MQLPAKKSLGQHFLTSKHVLEQIIDASNLQKGEIVLEIGPGTGILTEALLQKGANVVTIEKDHRAGVLLEVKFTNQINNGQLKFIQGDVLELDMNKIVSKSANEAEGRPLFMENHYALIANIPYYITGAILQKFLECEPRPNRMVLLVQKEVADRIVAKDDSGAENGKESILSISVKAFGAPKIITRVAKGAFSPPPTVDSAILSIENISDRRFREKNIEINKFFNIVRAGFAHKRKFAIRNLEGIISAEKLSAVWQKSGIDPKIRAEDIRLEQWLEITYEVYPHSAK